MTSYERIEKVIAYVDARPGAQPRLAELAKVAGLSESHFHRLFTRWAGITPKGFLQFVTAQAAKRLLLRKDVLTASIESGLSGPGRLHDLLLTVEGATPGQLRARGAGLEIRWGVHETPFGRALVAVAPRGLCHLAFVEGVREREAELGRLRARWRKARFREDRAGTAGAAERAFSRRRGLPVVLKGTPFQVKVWEALLRVPAGRAITYGQLAAAVGQAGASRAVGNAVGANALACVIPCHRVLRGTGAFGGYRWGTARKRAMLAWEAGESSALSAG